MSLIDHMLSRAVPRSTEGRRNVLVRVWLDDEGRVRDLKVRRSCGDRGGFDFRALFRLDVSRLGKDLPCGPKYLFR